MVLILLRVSSSSVSDIMLARQRRPRCVTASLTKTLRKIPCQLLASFERMHNSARARGGGADDRRSLCRRLKRLSGSKNKNWAWTNYKQVQEGQFRRSREKYKLPPQLQRLPSLTTTHALLYIFHPSKNFNPLIITEAGAEAGTDSPSPKFTVSEKRAWNYDVKTKAISGTELIM